MNLSTDELILKITATINRGIAQALISVDGHLIFVMSDGEQIDIGDIQGPVLEALKAYVDQNQVEVDETLTKQGQAADAFAVGDAFRETKQDISDRLPKSGGTMTGPLDMGGNSITGADFVNAAALAVTPVGSDPDAGGYLAAGESELGDDGLPVRIMELYGNAGDEPVVLRHLNTPREDSDAATKAYVDAVAGSGSAGADGGYYTPSVDGSGNLTWTASKSDMPAVDGANIKGPQGETGPQGIQGETGPAGADGRDGADGQPGADGKSAYQYAVDGGYTGSEAEFAAKLAAEMPTTLPNPNALTFTGAVTGSYDGSAPLTVEIPSGGGGGGITGFRRVVDTTLTEAAEIVNLTTDINGNTFSLSECYLFIEAACTEPATITYIPNGYWTAGTYMISGSKTATDYPYIYIAYACGGSDHFFGFELRHRTGVSMPNYNSNKSANWRPITSYKLAGKFAEGARFIIFGRDA